MTAGSLRAAPTRVSNPAATYVARIQADEPVAFAYRYDDGHPLLVATWTNGAWIEWAGGGVADATQIDCSQAFLDRVLTDGGAQ